MTKHKCIICKERAKWRIDQFTPIQDIGILQEHFVCDICFDLVKSEIVETQVKLLENMSQEKRIDFFYNKFKTQIKREMEEDNEYRNR